MLYLAIPAHNEAATIGVLLWRLRTVLAEFPREYEAVVYDDGSTDSTLEILQSYSTVMPLTILRGERRVGYAGAVDALCRYASKQTRYPRRDAILLLQGDFTDPPALVPEFAKRFEGGADIVVGERTALRTAPKSVRRLIRATPWLLRFFVGVQGVRDLTSSYRLIRISVLRDLLRNVGDAPVCNGDTTTSNVDLLLKLVPLARRVEAIPVEPTWEVRLRDTRIVAMSDAMSLFRWGWRSRGRRAVPSTAPESANDIPRPTRGRSDRNNRNDSRDDSRSDSRYEQSEEATFATADISRGPRRERNRPAGKPSRSIRNSERINERSAERKIDRPAAKAAAHDELLDITSVTPLIEEATATDSSMERPTRRKRSRGRRGDKKKGPSNTSDSVETLSAADAESSLESAAIDELDLSPLLSDAVADAETEVDGVNKTRAARKKRRRREGRGRNASRNGSESAELGASELEEQSESDYDGNSAKESDSDSSPDSEEPENADELSSEGEGRVRRRGRRGGARRSRLRIEGSENAVHENNNGGEGNHAPPPSGPSESQSGE